MEYFGTDQSVYISLNGTKYFTNNSAIIVSEIGTFNNTALTCHTDSRNCCKGIHNPDGSKRGFGEWLFPNGSSIYRNSVMGDEGFYWIRYFQAIRLYRQGDIQNPEGSYCCVIPDYSDTIRTFCANLACEFTESLYTSCDNIRA